MKTLHYNAILEGGNTPDPSTLAVPEDVYDLLDEYLDSTTSQLEELEEAALVYEQQVHADDSAANIRRILHKIKGESGMVGFDALESLFHEAENAFERLPMEKRTDMLLRLKDWVAELLTVLDG